MRVVRTLATVAPVLLLSLVIGHAERGGSFSQEQSVPACQTAPIHVSWSLDSRGRLDGAVLSGVTPGCYGQRYRLTVLDSAGRVDASASGILGSAPSAVEVPLTPTPVSGVASIALTVGG